MQQKSQRRFIAGAVCPQCGKLDRIAVDLDSDQRICVSCGFAEGRPGQAPPGSADAATPAESGELPTRVSRAAARRVETPAETVTLIDPQSDAN